MKDRELSVIWITMLCLAAALIVYGGAPAVHADPAYDSGCYCHNNGIGVWFNGTDFNEFGGVNIAPAGSFVLNVTSKNIAATGVVPGVQQWMTNVTDTSKFSFNPQTVQDNSAQDLNKAAGTMVVLYTIKAPASSGLYTATIYIQGTTIGVVVQVGNPTSSSSSSSSLSSTNSSSSQSTASSSSTSATSSSTSTKTTSTIAFSPPSVFYYSGELAVMAVGFGLLVAVVIWRYRER